MLTIEKVLADFSASDWLKTALNTALLRDPVDASNDAQVLADLLKRHADEALAAALAALNMPPLT